MKIKREVIILFLIINFFAMASNENIKLDIGFSGAYTPSNSFTGEAGLYSNPSNLIYAENSNVAVNFSVPLLITNDVLSGNGFIGETAGLDMEINKDLQDEIETQERELLDTNKDEIIMHRVDLFDPKADISAGFIPSVNGVNMIIKDKRYVIGFGYKKSTLNMNLMANDIGGIFEIEYSDPDSSEMPAMNINMDLRLNTNTKINNEYQKLSFGLAKDLQMFGLSLGLGMDYHSLYTDINSKLNGNLRLTIDGKEGEDIVFNYDNIYKNEINSPVYKVGANFNWKILKLGISYNQYQGGELDRYKKEAVLNQDDELNDKIKEQYPEYWNEDNDEIKIMAAAADLREEANDILGIMFEEGTPKTYNTKFQENNSYKISGLFNLGWFGNIGMDMEKYNKPLWKFKIKDSDLDSDASFLNDLKFANNNVVADTYNMDTIYKIYSKLLFLDANVIVISATGESQGKITLPVSGNIGTGFTIKDYDFKLGVSMSSGVGLTSQVKYKF